MRNEAHMNYLRRKTADEAELWAADRIEQLEREAAELKEAVALAYGYLWHVNNEPMAPVPLYSPETAAHEARKVLRNLMTNEQRGEAINCVQKLLGHNATQEALAKVRKP